MNLILGGISGSIFCSEDTKKKKSEILKYAQHSLRDVQNVQSANLAMTPLISTFRALLYSAVFG